MIETIFHILGLCPDSLSHLDLLDVLATQLPIVDLINLFRR
jgi:hypothetical protein